MEEAMNLQEYQTMVHEFRVITSVVRPNGRCCEKTFGLDHTPECCEQVAEGARLYFTPAEKDLLEFGLALPPRTFVNPVRGEVVDWDVNRALFHPDEMRQLLARGWLAETLESASHPLRPVLNGRHVIGVVGVDCCNLDLALGRYRRFSDILHKWWQLAVDELGVKPYYVTSRLRQDMVVI